MYRKTLKSRPRSHLSMRRRPVWKLLAHQWSHWRHLPAAAWKDLMSLHGFAVLDNVGSYGQAPSTAECGSRVTCNWRPPTIGLTPFAEVRRDLNCFVLAEQGRGDSYSGDSFQISIFNPWVRLSVGLTMRWCHWYEIERCIDESDLCEFALGSRTVS